MVLTAVLMLGGLGLIVGTGLAIASKIFYVYVDPRILAVEDALPGANCGGCGLPGCSANAEAIVAGKAAPNSCVAGGDDLTATIAALLGVSVEAREPDIARPGCTYGVPDSDTKFVYDGMSDCRAAALLHGGMKVCTVGCLGLGSCAEACPFDAIVMGPEGLPVVNEDRCTGCGTCERVCPKHIINLSSVTRRILREYTSDECTTPCQRACPAGINICEYIRQVTLGDYHRSVQVIKERNPFPTVIGRICPRPCEQECRRQLVDEPVAINFLKRYVSDYELERQERVLPYKAPSTGRKIAVIGGGVEGLSAAYFAARLGHAPTVFEATDKLGGMLRRAIASYRLPMKILKWDIQGILEMGVEAETGQALGRDFTIATLLEQGFESIFLASGGWDARLTRGTRPEENMPIPGTCLLVDFVKMTADARKSLAGASDVVIVGGGKLALQAATICKDAGAGHITIIQRESWQQSPYSDEELQAIGTEKLQVLCNSGVHQIRGAGNQLAAVEYMDLDSRAVSTLPARALILASGRFPELIFIKDQDHSSDSAEATAPTEGALAWKAVESYKQPTDGQEKGFLAQGDVLSDYSAAIRAIGAGRRGAASVHQIMYDIDPATQPHHVITPSTYIQNVDHVENVAHSTRHIMPLGSAKELAQGVELEKGYNEQTAQAEAARCLQCGLICYEGCGK